jgi:RimJ/RimL family protein N-acetyltransferase
MSRLAKSTATTTRVRRHADVELLQRVWRQGYATEASLAVLDWARSSGYERLRATVWDWNTASRRVLARAGFTGTERIDVDAAHGTTGFMTRRL